MRYYLQFIFLSLIIFSCDTPSEKVENKVEAAKEKVEIIKNNQIEKELAQIKQVEIEEGGIEIKFEDFQVNIDSVLIYDAEGSLKNIQKDTAIVYLELGESIEGVIFKISKHNKFDKIKIFQRFENSITIMAEGPHCDLTEWNHYNSEWKELKQINNKEYLTDSYSERDWELFVDIEIEDLIKAVKEKCGDEWANYIKNIKSPNEYPSGVSTSRIFIKILLEKVENGEEQEKIISFEIPMGC